MNMLDIGGGFTGTEFQLEEVNIVQWVDILDWSLFPFYLHGGYVD